VSTLASGPAQTNRMRAVAVLGLALALAWGIGTLMSVKDMATVRAAVVLSALFVVSLAVFWAAARSDPDGSLLMVVLILSFALKLLAAYLRFRMGLLADAFVYDKFGEDIARTLAAGEWPVMDRYWSTGFVRLVTGMVYLVTGPTLYGATILWAWFGLLGMLGFYKAFTVAFPDGNRRLYMALILLYPSMLLWTSSLGKDALMVLALGMGAYGTARLHRRLDVPGLWWLALGTAGMLMVRPHIVGVFVVALVVSMLVRPIRAGVLSPVIRLAGLAVLVPVALGLISTAAGFIRLESLTAESVLEFVEWAGGQTEQGGSAFARINPRTPVGFVVGTLTVLFRPFPWEAHTVFASMTALEGLGLLALVLLRWRSFKAALLAVRRDSYLVLVLVYALVFIFFFANMANFGVVARQRVQVYPFVFMLLAYPGTGGLVKAKGSWLSAR
jgi:hypothetical protein